MRDVRDVLVSYYHYYADFKGFEGTLLQFLCSNIRPMEWHDHVNSWIYNNSSLSNLCLLKYEDMLTQPYEEVDKALRFIGLQCTEDQIRRAIDACQFSKMKSIEKRKGLGVVLKGKTTSSSFVRKGKSGGWRDEFGEQEKTIVKTQYGSTLIKCGYEKSFDW
jgi:hypothetical protein